MKKSISRFVVLRVKVLRIIFKIIWRKASHPRDSGVINLLTNNKNIPIETITAFRIKIRLIDKKPQSPSAAKESARFNTNFAEKNRPANIQNIPARIKNNFFILSFMLY